MASIGGGGGGIGADIAPITPGSFSTPALDSSLDARHELALSQQASSGANADLAKANRFRFDVASTRGFVDSDQLGVQNQPQDELTRSNLHQQQLYSSFSRSSNFVLGSQGNLLNHLPHNSCTSITQNLSTSDQQPLIVDAHYDRNSCYHHVNNSKTHHKQQQQHHHHQPHHEQDHLNRCCLETTTSFMGYRNQTRPVLSACCALAGDPESAKQLGKTLRSSFGPANVYPEPCGDFEQTANLIKRHSGQHNKSRTLTRIYKPLNDMDFYTNAVSTSNLADTFPD